MISWHMSMPALKATPLKHQYHNIIRLLMWLLVVRLKLYQHHIKLMFARFICWFVGFYWIFLYLISKHFDLLIYLLRNYMATHPSILAWSIPWTEEPGRLQSIELQWVRHNRVTNSFTFFHKQLHTWFMAYVFCQHYSKNNVNQYYAWLFFLYKRIHTIFSFKKPC